MEPEMLKRKQLTEYVGLCYATIYKLEKMGQFPARREMTPGRVGWLRSEVQEWLESRKKRVDQ